VREEAAFRHPESSAADGNKREEPPFLPVISRYNRLGVAAIETLGKGGRRGQYLTLEEEKEFLAPFLRKPSVGRSLRWGRSGKLTSNASGTKSMTVRFIGCFIATAGTR
jgi:hypothetical protein